MARQFGHDSRQDLGLKVTDLFEIFEEEPIASASIAQVGPQKRLPLIRHVRYVDMDGDGQCIKQYQQLRIV